jgi:phosphoribosylformylglycinamidine (FGAM) synthase-like enzyme
MFNPRDYIQVIDENMVLCTNPVSDGGLSAITVNIALSPERKKQFTDSVKRMVLNKLFSPKFAEVIISATELNIGSQTHLQRA